MGSVISASALTENKLEWDRGIFAFIVIRLVWRNGFLFSRSGLAERVK